MRIEKFDGKKEVNRIPLAKGSSKEDNFVMSILTDGSGLVLEFEDDEAYFLPTQELVMEILNKRVK